MVNVYVTVGATVPFHSLIYELIHNLDILILNSCKAFPDFQSNTINIVIQYGDNYSKRFQSLLSTYLSTHFAFFKEISIKSSEPVFALLETNTTEYNLQYTTPTNNTITKQVNICGFALSNNISSFLHEYQPQLFITHAGTGSLLDALKLPNPSLSSSSSSSSSSPNHPLKTIIFCIVNNNLMDNHQLEIAHKFSSLKLVTCVESPKQLSHYLNQLSDIVRDTNSRGGASSSGDHLHMGYNTEFQNEVLLGNW